MLDATRGLWADWDEDVEQLLDDARQKWEAFVNETYGSLANDPIERGPQPLLD